MKLKFSRRFILKSALASISLPVLESLNPLAAKYGYASESEGPKFCFFFYPMGNVYGEWNPIGTGPSFTLPNALQALEPYKSELILTKGLCQPNFNGSGVYNGNGIDGHHFLSCAFMNSSLPDVPFASTNSETVDNALARVLGQGRSHYVTLEQLYTNDLGINGIFMISFSWDKSGVRNTALTTPKVLFESLFGRCMPSTNQAKRYQKYSKSMLDTAISDINYLKSKGSSSDALRLEQFATNFREAEKKLGVSTDLSCAHPEYLLDPNSFPDRMNLNFDIMALALQSGKSRVMNYMIDQDLSYLTFPWLGLNKGHHEYSHDASGKVDGPAIRKISSWYAEQFGGFLGRLKEAGILDTTVSTLLSNMCNRLPGEAHYSSNLPVIVGGGSNGILKTGQGIDTNNAPLANLFLTLIQRAGGSQTVFGRPNPDPTKWRYAVNDYPQPVSTGTLSQI